MHVFLKFNQTNTMFFFQSMKQNPPWKKQVSPLVFRIHLPMTCSRFQYQGKPAGFLSWIILLQAGPHQFISEGFKRHSTYRDEWKKQWIYIIYSGHL